MKKIFFCLLTLMITISPKTFLNAQEIEPINFTKNCGEYYCLKKGQPLALEIPAKAQKYAIGIEYISSGNLVIDDNVEFKLNNQLVNQQSFFTLPTAFEYSSQKFKVDRFGNEVLPQQKVNMSVQKFFLRPTDGTTSDSTQVQFKAGNNKLELTALTNEIKIKNVFLKAAETNLMYPSTKPTGEQIVIEAEHFTQKNDLAINAKNEVSNLVTPTETKLKKINVVDGNTFKKGGQQISYEIDVPTAGNYLLGLRGLNNDRAKTPVLVNIYVNGEVQSDYFQGYKIANTSAYQTQMSEKPLYLKAGKNQITIELSVEEYNQVLSDLNNVSTKVQTLGKEINKITGGTVDQNRDWQLTTYLPTVTKDLEEIKAQLVAVKEKLLKQTNGLPSENSNSVDLMIANIDELLTDPNNVPNNLELFSKGSTSVLALTTKLLKSIVIHPYSLDKLYFVPVGKGLSEEIPSFWSNQMFALNIFFSSFTQSETNEQKYTKEITVWTKRPRQYVDVLQQMTDEEFTPKTGIKVNFSLMTDQNKITMANSAGVQPDIVMGLDNWYIWELGFRGAFADVTQFAQTKEILKPMAAGSEITMASGDKLFGIPETQESYVMFYRKDILEEQNLTPPKTWDEMLEMVPTLQNNGMNFYLPIAGDTALKPFFTTYPFYAQRGLGVYSKDGITTTIDSPESVETMQFLVDLYTIYGLPASVPIFYDSFRDGSIPIGVSNFASYIQLAYAAPELSDKWAIALAPGTRQTDSTINHSMGGGQTASAILDKSPNKAESIDFFSWWMSTEVQIEYQQRVLATYGPEYLWNSANSEAFAALPLPQADLDVFAQTFPWILETPKTPGGYAVERGISDIWNGAVFKGENVKARTDEETDKINKELRRKYQEFNYLDAEGNLLKPYPIPTLESRTKAREVN
ncbi:MAG: extracellular solute-binding protein [Mycoplasmatales bacterium]